MKRTLHLLWLVLTLTACAPRMQAFPLPETVAPPAPAAPGLAALAGVWSGTWFTPDWGLGYQALLLVERLDAEQATLLYAWANPARGDEGWYRQKARVLPGPGLAWTRGPWTFRLQLSPDGTRLGGTTAQAAPAEQAFISMRRTPFVAPPPNPPRGAAALPPLPAAAAIPVPPGTPAAQARLLGIWEGTWDSGTASRLVVRGIAHGQANIVYEWSTDPQGRQVSGFRRLAAVNAPAGVLSWGEAPKLTFQLSADGQTLRGEWEQQGLVSVATLRKVAPE